MPYVTLRTRELSLAWSPQLGYFEARLDIMRQLDTNHGLAGFRVHADRLEALVRNVGEVSFGPDHLRVTALSPAYDAERFDDCVRLALEPFRPAHCRVVHRFQVLDPLDEDYDGARVHAIQAWTRPIAGTAPVDVAILYDGVDDETGYDFQIEYGVVQRSEIPDRLRRWFGRVGSGVPNGSGLDVDQSELPAVGVFADFTWHQATHQDNASTDQILTSCSDTMRRSLSIASHLHQQLQPTANRPDRISTLSTERPPPHE